MTERFDVRIEAERYIHNDLSNCAFGMMEVMRKKIESEETAGIYFEMMSSLIFTAFTIEAKINFVGWKVLEKGWPERDCLHEKIDLLIRELNLKIKWGERPLQTIAKLNGFRNTLAHGKPDIVDKTFTTHEKPDVWEALKGQWESSVTPENVEQCYADVNELWKILLEAAKIPVADTLTVGSRRLRKIVD